MPSRTTLTKARIVEAFFCKNILSRKKSARIIEILFELIEQAFQNGEGILITGFWKFAVCGKHICKGKKSTEPGIRLRYFKKSGYLQVIHSAAGGNE